MPDDSALRLHLSNLPDRPLLVLDLVQRRVTLSSRDCGINGRAFDLLQALGTTPGQPIRPQVLLATVWPGRVVVAANLRAQVQVLRRALGSAAVQFLGDRGYALLAEAAWPAAVPAGPAPVARPLSPGIARPLARAPLFGRDDDLAALQALLRSQRLVTVTGPVGVGKSHLALRALEEMAEDGAVRVARVDLSALPATASTTTLARALLAAWRSARDAPEMKEELPAARAAATLHARAHAGLTQAGANQPHLAAFQAFQASQALQALRGWLLLDNAEHLVGQTAGLAGEAAPPGPLPALLQWLLAAAPGLRLLITSQWPLGLAAEARCHLAPLPLPGPGATPADICANPAVRLLVSRATAADHRFALADADWPAAATIVHLLDGLPGAITQAGANLPLLGAAALAEHLRNPLHLMGPAARGRPGRHRTLRAAVDRSAAGLSAQARAAWVALALLDSPVPQATAAALLRGLGMADADAQALLQFLTDRCLLLQAAPAGFRVLAVHRAWALQALPTLPAATRRAIEAACKRLAGARPPARRPGVGVSAAAPIA